MNKIWRCCIETFPRKDHPARIRWAGEEMIGCREAPKRWRPILNLMLPPPCFSHEHIHTQVMVTTQGEKTNMKQQNIKEKPCKIIYIMNGWNRKQEIAEPCKEAIRDLYCTSITIGFNLHITSCSNSHKANELVIMVNDYNQCRHFCTWCVELRSE